MLNPLRCCQSFHFNSNNITISNNENICFFSENSENNQQKGENIVAQAHLANDFEQLKKDLQELQERHEAQIRDNAQLSRLTVVSLCFGC